MNVTRRRVGPTLAEEHVFRKVPEGRLHHVKVAAAHAVHEGGEEVFGQSVSGRRHRVMTQRLNSDSFNRTLIPSNSSLSQKTDHAEAYSVLKTYGYVGLW